MNGETSYFFEAVIPVTVRIDRMTFIPLEMVVESAQRVQPGGFYGVALIEKWMPYPQFITYRPESD